MTISVAIVEDNAAISQHLASLFRASPECRLVGVASTGRAALELLADTDVDVFVVDLGLPDMEGVDVIRRIAISECQPRILVVSAFGDRRHVMESFRAGAHGYVLKEDIGTHLIGRVIALYNGLMPQSPAVSKIVMEHLHRVETGGGALRREDILLELGISLREGHVLKLLMRGLPIREIANELHVSPHTVNQHLRGIYRKLKVTSRAMAVTVARHHGLSDD
ncbi:MAG: response regulator transcription factor [Candidatus Dactylopiibacterium sp.]|nr:response regulator transcription factor [Candidatus Dactylopiibacterium sp.]